MKAVWIDEMVPNTAARVVGHNRLRLLTQAVRQAFPSPAPVLPPPLTGAEALLAQLQEVWEATGGVRFSAHSDPLAWAPDPGTGWGLPFSWVKGGDQ